MRHRWFKSKSKAKKVKGAERIDGIDYISTLIRKTPNTFEAMSFLIDVQCMLDKPVTFNVLRFGKSTMIEIQPGVWSLTDFQYHHQIFKHVEDYKHALVCFVEEPMTDEQQHIINELESSSIGLAIDLSIASIETIEYRSAFKNSKNRISGSFVNIRYNLDENTYTFRQLMRTCICLLKDTEAYKQQIITWDEEMKRIRASKLKDLRAQYGGFN